MCNCTRELKCSIHGTCAECGQQAENDSPLAPCFSGKHRLCLATSCEMEHGEKCPKPEGWPSPEWNAAV